MARFQPQEGVCFHIKEDVIGDLEVPDEILDLLVFRRNGHLSAIETEPSA